MADKYPRLPMATGSGNTNEWGAVSVASGDAGTEDEAGNNGEDGGE